MVLKKITQKKTCIQLLHTLKQLHSPGNLFTRSAALHVCVYIHWTTDSLVRRENCPAALMSTFSLATSHAGHHFVSPACLGIHYALHGFFVQLKSQFNSQTLFCFLAGPAWIMCVRGNVYLLFSCVYVSMCVLSHLTDYQRAWQRGNMFIKQRQSTTHVTHRCSQLENNNRFHWPMDTRCREIATNRTKIPGGELKAQQLLLLNNNDNNNNNSPLYKHNTLIIIYILLYTWKANILKP